MSPEVPGKLHLTLFDHIHSVPGVACLEDALSSLVAKFLSGMA
jgi:hypothetical protein